MWKRWRSSESVRYVSCFPCSAHAARTSGSSLKRSVLRNFSIRLIGIRCNQSGRKEIPTTTHQPRETQYLDTVVNVLGPGGSSAVTRQGQATARPVWREDAQRLHCRIQPPGLVDRAVGHASTESGGSGYYGSIRRLRMRPDDRNLLGSERYQGHLSCIQYTHLLNPHQGGEG